MDEMRAGHIIRDLRKKWIGYTILSDLFLCMSVTVMISVVSSKLADISPWWAVVILIFLFAIVSLFRGAWRIKERGIARWLDQSYPSLEESSCLLLKSTASLNRLERLQQEKTEGALTAIPAPLKINGQLKRSSFILFATLLLGIIIYKLPYSFHKPASESNQFQIQPGKPEKILPQIEAAAITIIPPAYTAMPQRDQTDFNLDVEEGASVKWKLFTTKAVQSVKLIFNDSAVVLLTASDGSKRSWTTDNLVPAAGFYQVSVDSAFSDLYKVEIIQDKPPSVHILAPNQYTTVDFGEPQEVAARIELSDDYAVSDASLIATIASGSGEAVKFKEQKMILPGFAPGHREYHLQKLLSLPPLGLQPGDDLYFYVKVTDNHKQETRSDTYIINLADTAQLMSLEGLANGINVKPEYFRSQRQIIIETEQLLKDKDTISVETFKNRSNNLGIDQKMLRLRYGKFLGEEDESSVVEGDRSGDLADPSNFSNADKLKDAFTDKHDNAEDATYLEPGTKKQLRATLTEMWNAELQLRTFKPIDALPFEYKALRLLKDLQQQSRVYVAKTNQKTTPLDLQKRLTGDLSKITSPLLQRNVDAAGDPLYEVRLALSLLEQLRITGSTKGIAVAMLHSANRQLNEKAIQQPSAFLPAVQAMRKITAGWDNGAIGEREILVAESGLQKLLSAPEQMPGAATVNSAGQLSKEYFLNLQKNKQ